MRTTQVWQEQALPRVVPVRYAADAMPPDDLVDPETASMYLADVTPLWRAFWFHMHLMAKNLEEFAAGLGQISDEVFAYHVSGQKNDLARWVQEVIGDSALAHALADVKSRDEAALVTRRRVEQLKTAAANAPSV